MRLSIISDTHLEFLNGYAPILDHKKADLIIDAGDIHPNPDVRENWKNICEKIAPYFSVKGNHDYYRSIFPMKDDDQFVLEKDGLKIVGCTLWSKFPEFMWPYYINMMACATSIKNNTYQNMISKFESDLKFIEESNADIVVTHFSPSMRSVGPKFVGASGNEFFHNQLDTFILDMKKKPLLWIHGHTHERSSYNIGETMIVCNPHGYPGENAKAYAPKIVDIKDGKVELVE